MALAAALAAFAGGAAFFWLTEEDCKARPAGRESVASASTG
jgi:hypothetical protein